MGRGEDGPAEGFRRRRDGFTAAKRKAFVAALAKHGTVADACRAAGVSTTTFYRHEKRDADFASLCRAARAQAAGNIETLAWERAVTGIEEAVIHYGKVVGVRRRRSDAIFRLLLQASDPKKYGRTMGRGGGRSRKAIERKVRRQVEAERWEADAQRADADLRELERRLGVLHRRTCARPDCPECGAAE